MVISDIIMNYIEVFDGLWVYLEIYEWVKKMVVDVFEYDEVMMELNLLLVLEEILEVFDRLKDLDLDVFVEELEW